MYYCNPLQGERFYLWLLLTIVHRATSFKKLRTIHSTIYTTCQQACLTFGLLKYDWEWIQCFEEGIIFALSSTLRTLFATAVLHGGLIDANTIWVQFG